MAEKAAYSEAMKQEFGQIIDALELEDLQKRFLRSRWLDQVLWMEGRANRSRNWYFPLRLLVIVGGVLIPALVGWKTFGTDNRYVNGLTFVLSLLVAIGAAVEEFFHHGDRWRHYRRTVELLKIEGWQFFTLSGPYRRHRSHEAAFESFATRIEGIIQPSVEVYITDVAREREDAERQPAAPVASALSSPPVVKR